jgi:hypothetical protein
MIENYPHLVRMKLRQYGSNDRSHACDGKVGNAPLGRVLGKEHYPIAGSDTVSGKRSGNGSCSGKRLTV